MEGRGPPVNSPDKVEEIFCDFMKRRAGLIKALTSDYQQFYQQCDPENNEGLCLFGLQNETWAVSVPSEKVPVDYPEPVVGINFVRDTMSEIDWLSLVALRSDSWLIALAFFFGASNRINKTNRNRLFQMINNLPTIYEVLFYVHPPNDHSSTHNSSSEIESSRKTQQSETHTSKPMKMTMPPKEDEHGVEEYEEDENDITLCGTCREIYIAGEFWICCDTCEEWFHGECVRVTPEIAKQIDEYKCPRCSRKRTQD